MKTKVVKRVYETLRSGWERLTPEAQQAVRDFVKSQRTANGYMNAGGKEDPYYRQFGKVLEAVFSPWKLAFFMPDLVVKESVGQDNVYGLFMDYLSGKASAERLAEVNFAQHATTNAACCLLVMQQEVASAPDATLVTWLQQRQDETGGFYASELAPIPDMLSTAVALFTLQYVEAKAQDASDFIQAHWIEEGAFSPTVLDEYSDVEYVFYGLLALGSC